MSRRSDGRTKRRPVRAILGGIFFGLGLALLLVNFKVIAFGTLAPFVAFGIGVVVGVVIAFFAPPRPRLKHPGPAPNSTVSS
jgi:hypothetical protein